MQRVIVKVSRGSNAMKFETEYIVLYSSVGWSTKK